MIHDAIPFNFTIWYLPASLVGKIIPTFVFPKWSIFTTPALH